MSLEGIVTRVVRKERRKGGGAKDQNEKGRSERRVFAEDGKEHGAIGGGGKERGRRKQGKGVGEGTKGEFGRAPNKKERKNSNSLRVGTRSKRTRRQTYARGQARKQKKRGSHALFMQFDI